MIQYREPSKDELPHRETVLVFPNKINIICSEMCTKSKCSHLFFLICMRAVCSDVACVSVSALCAAWLPLLTAADCERLWGCHSSKVLLNGNFWQHAGVSASIIVRPWLLWIVIIVMGLLDAVRSNLSSQASHALSLLMPCLLLLQRRLHFQKVSPWVLYLNKMLPLCV